MRKNAVLGSVCAEKLLQSESGCVDQPHFARSLFDQTVNLTKEDVFSQNPDRMAVVEAIESIEPSQLTKSSAFCILQG